MQNYYQLDTLGKKATNYAMLNQLIQENRLEIICIYGTPRSGSTIMEMVFSKLADISRHQPFRSALTDLSNSGLRGGEQDFTLEHYEYGCSLILSDALEQLQAKEKATIIVKEVSDVMSEEYVKKWSKLPSKFLITFRSPELQIVSGANIFAADVLDGFKPKQPVDVLMDGILQDIENLPIPDLNNRSILQIFHDAWYSLLRDLEIFRKMAETSDAKKITMIDITLLRFAPEAAIHNILERLAIHTETDKILQNLDDSKIRDTRTRERASQQRARKSKAIELLGSTETIDLVRLPKETGRVIHHLLPIYVGLLASKENSYLPSVDDVTREDIHFGGLLYSLLSLQPLTAYSAVKAQTEINISHVSLPSKLTQTYSSFIARSKKVAPRINELAQRFEDLASGREEVPLIIPVEEIELFKGDYYAQKFSESHNLCIGPMMRHAYASIPYIREETIRIGSAICLLNTQLVDLGLHPLIILQIDGAEGTLMRSLSKHSEGSIQTLNTSPTVANKIEFDRLPVEGSHFWFGSHTDITPELLRMHIGLKPFRRGFDIIIETLGFQMYGSNRTEQIGFIAQNLKPGGILILIEKFNSSQSFEEYLKREQKKDKDFKAKFFNASQIQHKKDTILPAMQPGQVTKEELAQAVREHFDYAVQTWNSCNFSTVIASNDKGILKNFLSCFLKPAIPDSFSYESVPNSLPGFQDLNIKFRLPQPSPLIK
jgi:tRNA (cmo5U34)-methyltransferase